MRNRLKVLLSLDRYIWILFVCYFGLMLFIFFSLGFVRSGESTISTGIISSFFLAILPIYLFIKSFGRYQKDLSIWISFGLTRKQFFTTNLTYYALWSGIVAFIVPILVQIEHFIGRIFFQNYVSVKPLPLFSYQNEELRYFETAITIFFVYIIGIIIFHAIASLMYYLKVFPIIRIFVIIGTIFILIFGDNDYGNFLTITFVPIYVILALAINYITLMKSDIPS